MTSGMAAADYLRECREAAGMTLEQVALCIDTVPPVSARERAALLGSIEAGLVPISLSTAVALAAVPMLGIELTQLAALVDEWCASPRMTAPGTLMVLVGRRA